MRNLRKMYVVAAREYKTSVRTKAFLISLFLMPTLMFAGILIPMLLKDRVETKVRKYLVVDRTPGSQLASKLEAAVNLYNATTTDEATGKQLKTAYALEIVPPSGVTPEAVLQQRFELSELIRRKEYHGLLEIGADVVRPGDRPACSSGDVPDAVMIRYQSNSALAREFPRFAEKVVNAAVQEQRCQELQLPYQPVQLVQLPVPLLSRGLASTHPITGEIQDGREDNPVAAFLLPYGMMFLMFMMVFMGAMPLMQGVIEEKTNRIAEVLLGSIPPFYLMLGKLIGTVCTSLTLSAVYLTGIVIAARYYGYTDHVAPEVMAWFVLFQVLGILLFGSMMIAVGAACTNLQESQTLVMPVSLLAAFPMFFLERVIREPDGPLMTWLSFFPPATPTLMVTRLSIPPGIAWWQPVLGTLVLLAATLLCVYAAGRIFRVGLLVQGKGAGFRQMLSWVVRG